MEAFHCDASNETETNAEISLCFSLENRLIWKYRFPHLSSRRLCVHFERMQPVIIWHKYNGVKEEYFLHDGAVLL